MSCFAALQAPASLPFRRSVLLSCPAQLWQGTARLDCGTATLHPGPAATPCCKTLLPLLSLAAAHQLAEYKCLCISSILSASSFTNACCISSAAKGNTATHAHTTVTVSTSSKRGSCRMQDCEMHGAGLTHGPCQRLAGWLLAARAVVAPSTTLNPPPAAACVALMTPASAATPASPTCM